MPCIFCLTGKPLASVGAGGQWTVDTEASWLISKGEGRPWGWLALGVAGPGHRKPECRT